MLRSVDTSEGPPTDLDAFPVVNEPERARILGALDRFSS